MERGLIVKTDGRECLLRTSGRTLVVYRLTSSSTLIVVAALAAIVLGGLAGIWGGLAAGAAVWISWYKFYLPYRSRKRMEEDPEPDDRIDLSAVAAARPDGARKLLLTLRADDPPPAVAPASADISTEPTDPMLDKIFGRPGPSSSPPVMSSASEGSPPAVRPAAPRQMELEFLSGRDRRAFERVIPDRVVSGLPPSRLNP